MEELLCGLLKLFLILFLVLDLNPGPCVCQACFLGCNLSMLFPTRIPDESCKFYLRVLFSQLFFSPSGSPRNGDAVGCLVQGSLSGACWRWETWVSCAKLKLPASPPGLWLWLGNFGCQKDNSVFSSFLFPNTKEWLICICFSLEDGTQDLSMPGRCPTSKPHPRTYILAASLVARAWAIVCSLVPCFLRSSMKIILWFETVSYWVTLASPGGIHCVDQSSPEVTVLRAKVCITLAWSSLSHALMAYNACC